jgi:hypothetical protein
MRAGVRLLFSAILAVVVPVSQLAAETGAAMLQAQGKVTVNGKPAGPNSVTIFPGDQIATDADSAATITSQGSLMMLGANSALKFGESAIDVGCGALTMSTSGRHVSAHVGNLTVDPAADSSKFEISRVGGKLQIGARDGNLLIDDGKQKATLEAGKAMSFDSPGECALPPAEPEATAAKPSGFALSRGKLILISSLAAGGITAAVVVAEKGKDKCVSPDGSKKCKCKDNQQGNNNCQ